MAMGILGAMGSIARLDQHLLIGELSLDGGIRSLCGALSVTVCSLCRRLRILCFPMENVAEAVVVDGVHVFGARHRFYAKTG